MSQLREATILLIESSDERADTYLQWLDDCEVMTAETEEAALSALSSDVDVVLLDAELTDPPAEKLLGSIRARGQTTQIGLLSGDHLSADIFRFDFDEYIPRPLGRTELRNTVARLTDHGAVDDAVATYLRLVMQRRQIEARRDETELATDERYRELTGEIAARRRQIASLLAEIDNPATEVDDGEASSVPPLNNSEPLGSHAAVPLYQTRAAEFYGLWFGAALTYGVGDVLSTLYATAAVPGLIEANPIVGTLLATSGLAGFLLLKLLVLLVLLSVSVQGARRQELFSYYWPPIVASGIGIVLTSWNVRLIVGA